MGSLNSARSLSPPLPLPHAFPPLVRVPFLIPAHVLPSSIARLRAAAARIRCRRRRRCTVKEIASMMRREIRIRRVVTRGEVGIVRGWRGMLGFLG